MVLSTKEWRALPKEERDNYIKQTASKDYVERVSYAKVWGETRKAKSEDAMLRVEERKKEEAAAKREEQAKQSRYQDIIDRFINEGYDALKSFSKTGRIDFIEKEANAIYYGIMATASKYKTFLSTLQREWKQPQSNSLQVCYGMIAVTFARNVSCLGQRSLPQRESFIPNPFVKTYLHLSTTCHVAPIPMSHSATQTDVPTNLRIGMASRRPTWEHQPRERRKSVDRTHNVCHTKAQFQQVQFWITPHQFPLIPQLTISFFRIYSLF